MNLYALSSAAASVSCLTVGTLVLLKGPQRELNQSFARIAAVAGVWTAFPFAISLPEDEQIALTVARWVYVFAAFVPPAFFSLLL